jgi:glutamine synthetase
MTNYQLTKKVADDMERSITFMAKPNAGAIGNSANIKLILKDKDGNNLLESIKFFTIDNTGNNTFKHSLGENSVAGIINHIQDFILFYCPTVNSFKRLKEPYLFNNWNKLGHMQDNMGLNVITEGECNKLLFKIPGSDANIYLALYALLTSVKVFVI